MQRGEEELQCRVQWMRRRKRQRELQKRNVLSTYLQLRDKYNASAPNSMMCCSIPKCVSWQKKRGGTAF